MKSQTLEYATERHWWITRPWVVPSLWEVSYCPHPGQNQLKSDAMAGVGSAPARTELLRNRSRVITDTFISITSEA